MLPWDKTKTTFLYTNNNDIMFIYNLRIILPEDVYIYIKLDLHLIKNRSLI